MDRRRNAALAAAQWLGAKEGTKEHREILAVYNSIRPLPRGYKVRESDAWCAAFVSAVDQGLAGIIDAGVKYDEIILVGGETPETRGNDIYKMISNEVSISETNIVNSHDDNLEKQC